jgi:hypothetical protein
MARVVRVVAILAFAVVWAAGSFAVAFLLLSDSMALGLGLSVVGGVIIGVALGSLTDRAALFLLGIPIAIAALGASVYLAGAWHMRDVDLVQVMVAKEECVEYGLGHRMDRICTRHKYELTYPDGRPVTDRLQLADEQASHQVGDVLDVYQVSPGVLHEYTDDDLSDEPLVRRVAFVVVPLFVVYVVLLALVGAVSQSRRTQRRP